MSCAIQDALPHLRTLVSDVLEAMLFSEAEPIDDVFDWSDPSTYYSEVDIQAPLAARMRIGIPRPLAEEFAMNLAPGAEEDELAILDLLGELSNTLAGRLGAALCQPGEAVQLSLPCTRLGHHTAAAANDVHQTYNVGDNLLGVALSPALSHA